MDTLKHTIGALQTEQAEEVFEKRKTAHSFCSSRPDGVDLINEDDARSKPPGLGKQVADPTRCDSLEHLHREPSSIVRKSAALMILDAPLTTCSEQGDLLKFEMEAALACRRLNLLPCAGPHIANAMACEMARLCGSGAVHPFSKLSGD